MMLFFSTNFNLPFSQLEVAFLLSCCLSPAASFALSFRMPVLVRSEDGPSASSAHSIPADQREKGNSVNFTVPGCRSYLLRVSSFNSRMTSDIILAP